jgi:hypothetical protein
VSKFALQGEWQRRNDRKSIGASLRWLAPPLSEPDIEHGSGIVGDIGERSDAHPVCESESNSTLPALVQLGGKGLCGHWDHEKIIPSKFLI